MLTCCVTGHRPSGFPFSRDEDDIAYICYRAALIDEVKFLVKYGCELFIMGGCYGADLDFADSVLFAKNINKDEDTVIELEAALPIPYKRIMDPTPEQEEREEILFDCDKITAVCDHYHRGAMQERNRYMVDKSDIVLAIWNGTKKGGTWNTIKYALSKGKKVRYIMLNDIVAEASKLLK